MISESRGGWNSSLQLSFGRTLAAGMLAAAGALSGALVASAQTQPAWKPEKAVEIIVGVGAGGPQDHMGRMLQKVMQDNRWFDAPITVVNKPGGGGGVGLAYLNQHAGDGRFVIIHTLALFTNRITGTSAMSYTDFTPLAVLGAEYPSVAVRADSPITSGKELVERLRKDPGSLSVAVGTALGNPLHLGFVLAMKTAGVDIRKLKTVVFNSGSEGTRALLGGHVDATVSGPSGILQHVRAGKLRILATGAPQRIGGDLANLPTWKELGVNSTYEVWRGLAGPKSMTGAQIAFWDDVLGKVVRTEAWRKDLEQRRVENVYKNSTETGRYWKAQNEEARAVLSDLGLAK